MRGFSQAVEWDSKPSIFSLHRHTSARNTNYKLIILCGIVLFDETMNESEISRAVRERLMNRQFIICDFNEANGMFADGEMMP